MREGLADSLAHLDGVRVLFERLELTDKAGVGAGDFAAGADEVEGVFEGEGVDAYEVGADGGGGATDPGGAVPVWIKRCVGGYW